jgi:quercetin dioxygenase-like cupin family protein
MAPAGDEIHGGKGFRLRLVRTAAETGGEVLEMEATYGGSGRLPPEHFHPAQDERFEVLDGAVRAMVGGTERVYRQGDTFEVPAGTPHQMAADEPARMRWEVRPALRTEQFFKEIYKERSAKGLRAFLRRAAVLSEFRGEFRLTSPPDALQRLLFGAVAPLGRRL